MTSVVFSAHLAWLTGALNQLTRLNSLKCPVYLYSKTVVLGTRENQFSLIDQNIIQITRDTLSLAGSSSAQLNNTATLLHATPWNWKA